MVNSVKLKEKYHHGELREQVLKEALKLIREEGVEQLTFARLAKACGVARSAFYRHFDSKQQLLVTLAIDGYDQLAAKLIAIRSHKNNQDHGALTAVGMMYVEFAIKNPALYKLMFATEAISRSQDADLRAASQQTFDVLLAFIASLSGQSVDSQSCRVTALAAWSLVHGYVMLTLSKRVERVMEVSDHTVIKELLSHFSL